MTKTLVFQHVHYRHFVKNVTIKAMTSRELLNKKRRMVTEMKYENYALKHVI